MRLLFLDIDGVLNSHKYFAEHPLEYDHIDPENVRWMAKVVSDLELHVVISSTWRILSSIEEITKMLEAAGWHCPPIVGKTPRLPNGFRGDEVEKFLETTDLVVEDYVCVDDDSDFHPRQKLVKTSFDRGFTKAEADKVREVLKY